MVHRLTILMAAWIGLGAAVWAEPPRVVSATPDLGDTDVDPGLTELRVEFDQDMDVNGGYSVCGGGPTFPKLTGRPRWASARLLIVPVALEPSRTYELSINCPAAQGFRSAAGEPAEITPITFTTAASPAEARSASLTSEVNARAVETLRRALNERYSHRDVRLVDWDAEIGAVAGRLHTARTPGAFAREAARLLRPARDVHMSLQVGSARIPTFTPLQAPNCDVQALRGLVPEWRERGPVVVTGRFEDGVAYVLILSWPGDAAAVQPAIDFIREQAQAPGLIIDVRPNGGGDELTARRVAACFASEPVVYSRNAYRDPGSSGGWTAMYDRVLEPLPEGPVYTGPAAVLMGPACMSSNESFLLMMRATGRAVLVGEPSYGSSGNPKPIDLGNGVTLILPSWKDMLPDGTPLEGRGVIPDVGVRARPDEFRSGDPVLEAGLRAVRRRR